MLLEIAAAVEFLSKPFSNRLPAERTQSFRDSLRLRLHHRFQNHWDPSAPSKGNAFRALCFFPGKLDPIVAAAARDANIENAASYFPPDLVVWTDPMSVTYRVGDFGYVHMIYEDKTNGRVQISLPPSPPQSNPDVPLGSTPIVRAVLPATPSSQTSELSSSYFGGGNSPVVSGSAPASPPNQSAYRLYYDQTNQPILAN